MLVPARMRAHVQSPVHGISGTVSSLSCLLRCLVQLVLVGRHRQNVLSRLVEGELTAVGMLLLDAEVMVRTFHPPVMGIGQAHSDNGESASSALGLSLR